MRDSRPRAELTLEQQYALDVLDQLLSSSKESEDDRLRIRTQSQVGVLTEAEKMLDRVREGQDKAQAMLLVAEVKVRLDPVQGFAAMEGTVRAFNDADAAGRDAPAPAGSMMTMVLGGMFRMEPPDFGPSFYLLARADFNRAAQLAQRFARKDRAVLAQVAACRGVLVKRAEKTP